MIVLSAILAQPLAPDNIWFALLLLAALAWMHRLEGLRARAAGRQHAQHPLREISRRLHERIVHGHH